MRDTKAPKLIGWKVASLSTASASVRYRGFLQLQALKGLGYKNRIFAHPLPTNLDDLDALVMVKSLTLDDYILAQDAQLRNIPIILDLCDNIFIDTYKNNHTAPAQFFLAMAAIAVAIIATTEPLAKIIREHTQNRIPVYVVPDGVETEKNLQTTNSILANALLKDQESFTAKVRSKARHLWFRLQEIWSEGAWFAFKYLLRLNMRLAFRILRQLCRPLRRYLPVQEKISVSKELVNTDYDPAARQLLWFGFHGAPHAKFGILDLLDIKEDLRQIAREFPVQLVVVSNNIEKFNKYIQPLPIPSRYVEWSAAAQELELRRADLVLVPNTNDDFSRCKSANRTVTALTRNLPVVASATPALEPLASAIVLNNFLGGIRTYLQNPQKVLTDVKHGQALIKQLYNPAVLGRKLAVVVEEAIKAAQPTIHNPALIVVLQLSQDLDLALPILKAAITRNITVEAYCAAAMIRRSARTMEALRAAAIPIKIIAEELAKAGSVRFPTSAKALLTVTETNLGPHRFSRALTVSAKKQHLHTATLQHGIENVGLTYTDHEHAIDQITIAADRIYTWGMPELLLPEVIEETRSKCLPVGCPKPARVEPADFKNLLPDDRPVVGIFENLHWHRYSDIYRALFLARTYELAASNPDYIFLLKPHHAGQWLTARYEGEKKELSNLVIADPGSAAWQAYTAPALLGGMQAVITTPSTVALDAARMGLPTAVVAFDLTLPRFAPLPLLDEQPANWQGFVDAAMNPASRRELVARSEAMVDKIILSGDACGRILDDLGFKS